MTLDKNAVTLYQDGEAVATSSDITLRPADFMPVRNYIGRSQFTADALFSGSIGDVRIYNAALTGAEVQTVMNGGEPTAARLVSDDEAARGGNADKVYNLAGQEQNAQALKKGVYIKNGRKIAYK